MSPAPSHGHPPALKLGTATKEELNAAYDAVLPDLTAIINQWVPPFFRSQALTKLKEPQTIAMLVKLCDDAIEAVDNYRAEQGAKT